MTAFTTDVWSVVVTVVDLPSLNLITHNQIPNNLGLDIKLFRCLSKRNFKLYVPRATKKVFDPSTNTLLIYYPSFTSLYHDIRFTSIPICLYNPIQDPLGHPSGSSIECGH